MYHNYQFSGYIYYGLPIAFIHVCISVHSLRLVSTMSCSQLTLVAIMKQMAIMVGSSLTPRLSPQTFMRQEPGTKAMWSQRA